MFKQTIGINYNINNIELDNTSDTSNTYTYINDKYTKTLIGKIPATSVQLIL